MSIPPRALHPFYRPPPLGADNRDLVRNAGREMVSGLNLLCDDSPQSSPQGVRLALCVAGAGESFEIATGGQETALLPIEGEGVLVAGNRKIPFSRSSWRDESCLVVHAPAGTSLRVEGGRCEVAVVQTPNEAPFALGVREPKEIASERRGEGLAGDMALRIVRTAFDHTNKPSGSTLTLGEVVNFPGKWSSYPGHVHPQPEWYLYRFEQPGGYGVGRNGDTPYEVQHNDVLRIHPNHRHEQVAAPAFWMYYLWAVRDLPEQTYTGFTYQDQRHVDAFWKFSAEK